MRLPLQDCPTLDICRIILQSLVRTADKNDDKVMDFNEFEGFNDFEDNSLLYFLISPLGEKVNFNIVGVYFFTMW